MKIKELRAKGEPELKNELVRLQREVQELSTKLRMNQVKNVRQVRGMRKDIARILTLLSSK
jgi:ribosomal protein L29